VREWLTDIADVTGGAVPFAARYSYFANGNIQLAEYNNLQAPMEPRYRYQYAYDNANRLINANYFYHTGSGFSGANRFKVTDLQYDGNGNILALSRYKEDNSVIDQLSYSYTAGSNKLASVTDAVNTTPEDWDAEDTQFNYDGNGNVVEMLENGQPAISAITYDHRNLPVSLLNRNGDVVTYRYNAAGQRIYKKVGSQSGEHYILDGDQNVAVFDENGSLKYWNILANGVVGRRDAAGNKFYYLKDHLGSTRAVVNASGTVVEAHDYYPFGLLMPGRDYQSGSETKEKFTGKERDAETGLDYFGARYYWAAGGRWWSVDPLLEKYPDWSPYSYTFANPIIFFDPNGEEVRVYTEYLTFLGVFAFRHSFIRITTNDLDVTIELQGPTQDTYPKGNPEEIPITGEGFESGMWVSHGRLLIVEHRVTRPEGIAQDDYTFENTILDIFRVFDNNINILPDYNAFGPNSNGFVRFLIEQAGGKVKLPFSAYFDRKKIEAYKKAYQEYLKRKKEKQNNRTTPSIYENRKEYNKDRRHLRTEGGVVYEENPLK